MVRLYNLICDSIKKKLEEDKEGCAFLVLPPEAYFSSMRVLTNVRKPSLSSSMPTIAIEMWFFPLPLRGELADSPEMLC
jgi:hypothetical protein